MTDNDPDLDRIMAIAANGLERSREEEDEDLHLDTFAIVSVWAWKDENGDDCEGYSVWSETRRSHVQFGILVGGFSRLMEGGGTS